MVTTKKIFKFLAKQGQHDQIARLLTANFGKPTLQRYNGPRGEGVMITLELNEGVSKKTIIDYFSKNDVVFDWHSMGPKKIRIVTHLDYSETDHKYLLKIVDKSRVDVK